MITQFFTIGLLMLLSAMLPGPDFALVTKNTLLHSRRSGMFTSLGIGCALMIHISYCALGLAIVISNSLLLFNFVKYIGAGYLLYLGVTALLAKTSAPENCISQSVSTKSKQSALTAFRQGFLCNLFNPKVTLFFLALFTVIIKPDASKLWLMFFAVEMFLIVTSWFCVVTVILSHPPVAKLLQRVEKYISKAVGMFLIGFGVVLVGAHK